MICIMQSHSKSKSAGKDGSGDRGKSSIRDTGKDIVIKQRQEQKQKANAKAIVRTKAKATANAKAKA